MGRVLIGTSGWQYRHWKGVLYPPDLALKGWLQFYAKKFPTVEINSTFYHLPRPLTVENWVRAVPADFTFAIKASRFITHLKRLLDPLESLAKFWQVIKLFGKNLGPLLFQSSPGLKEDLSRLESFLEVLAGTLDTKPSLFAKASADRQIPKNSPVANSKGFTLGNWQPRFVFEFRHQSWFNREVYQLLKSFNAALCFSDTPRYPYSEEITADFVYLRLHGHQTLYASEYSEGQLREYAKKIRDWQKRVGDVYCYFDNDAYGFAIKNALRLKELCGRVH